MSLRTLLDHPELESAVEVTIANEYANSRGAFEMHAKQWTLKCAREGSVSTGST